ncbi:MAG: FixH family protein [Myxococcota bacterium]
MLLKHWVWFGGMLCGLLSCSTGVNRRSVSTERFLTIRSTMSPEQSVTGQNTMFLTLRSKDGTPFEDAKIQVIPDMPQHGHGSSEQSIVTPMGDGEYKVFPVTFQMPGAWQIRIQVNVQGKVQQEVFSVDVQ